MEILSCFEKVFNNTSFNKTLIKTHHLLFLSQFISSNMDELQADAIVEFILAFMNELGHGLNSEGTENMKVFATKLIKALKDGSKADERGC